MQCHFVQARRSESVVGKPDITLFLLAWCLRSSWDSFCATWFAASFPKSRSFGSAEERFAQDDRSFFDMNIGDRTLAGDAPGGRRSSSVRIASSERLTGPARSIHPSRSYPGNERRQLPPQAEPRTRDTSTPHFRQLYALIHWPTFTPPRWPGFAPPLKIPLDTPKTTGVKTRSTKPSERSF